MLTSFEAMWRRQLAFTALTVQRLRKKSLDQLTDVDRQELMHDYVEALHGELTELLGTTSWKRHRFLEPASRECMLEEMVDVQKYLWGLEQCYGVTPAELAHAFNRKSDVVEQRFRQEHELPTMVNRSVVVVDIDDTVADWSGGFDRWVAENEPGLSPEDYVKHVDPGLRSRLKRRARESGVLLTLESLPGAVEAVQRLASSKQVVWLTARQVTEHPRVVADTVQWLQAHNLPSDYVYYSDLNKHLFVLSKLPMAVALFDDDPEIVAHAKECGVQAYLVHCNGDLAFQVGEFLGDESRSV